MNLIKFDVLPASGKLPTDFPAFLKYVWKKNPGLWVLFFVTDILHFSRYPAAYFIFGKIIDILQKSDRAQGIPSDVQHYLITLVVIVFFGELMHVFTSYIDIHWDPKLRTAIRSDFLYYTMGHSHTYFQDNFAGAIARKVSEVAESALRLSEVALQQIGFAIIHFTANFILLCIISWIYGGVLLAFVAAILLPIFIKLGGIRMRSLRYSEERANVTGVVVDMLTNMPAVKYFSALSHESDVHAEKSVKEQKRASKLIRSMIQIENIRRLCLVLFIGGMASFACYGWAQGWITVGEAAAITSLSISMTGTTWTLGAGIVQFVDQAGYVTDALRITARPHSIKDKPEAAVLEAKSAAIDFEQVNFSFANNPIFKELDLHIASGEKIALVGPPGAGKSTLVAILMRLHDIEDGRIFIDGQDISGVTQDSLRDAIAVIPQDTALFHRSLMENIRYGRRGATDDEVIKAAKKAFAHDFIAGLPEGYDTLVGERGIKLSGGQRQRIAIARALLKNAPILILDEATSALDSESERLIQNALDELMVGKTVIAIAHRLSTISRMDRIIVLNKGDIVEQGSHDALLARRGLYAKLWAMQSGGFLKEEGLDLSSGNREEIAIKTIDG